MKSSPFPYPKPVSPFVPGVGDRIALLEPLMEHGYVAVAAGRQGRVISRVCGVFVVQFDHETRLPNVCVRHVFEEAITVLRRGLGKAAA